MATTNPRVSAYLQPENYTALVDYAARRGVALKTGNDGKAQISSALINQVLTELLISDTPAEKSNTPDKSSNTPKGSTLSDTPAEKSNTPKGSTPENDLLEVCDRLSHLENRVQALEDENITKLQLKQDIGCLQQLVVPEILETAIEESEDTKLSNVEILTEPTQPSLEELEKDLLNYLKLGRQSSQAKKIRAFFRKASRNT